MKGLSQFEFEVMAFSSTPILHYSKSARSLYRRIR